MLSRCSYNSRSESPPQAESRSLLCAGFRHQSPIYGLFPSNLYSPVHQPQWAAAAKRLVDRRLAHGGGRSLHSDSVLCADTVVVACFSTGWSAAWLVNAYARLLDGDAAFKQVHSLLSNFTGMFFPVHVLLLDVISPANSVN